MKFIELTEITGHRNGTVASEIVGKTSIPVKLIAKLTDGKLLPPKDFYTKNEIDYNIPTTEILLDCKSQPITISVAENRKAILHEIKLLKSD